MALKRLTEEVRIHDLGPFGRSENDKQKQSPAKVCIEVYICGKCNNRYSSLDELLGHKHGECLMSDIIILNEPMVKETGKSSKSTNPTETLLQYSSSNDQIIIIEDRETAKFKLPKVHNIDSTSTLTSCSKKKQACNKVSCTQCNRVFRKQYDYNQHERSHTGERPFQCVICGKMFAQKCNVKKHLMTHKVLPNGKLTLTMRDTDDIDNRFRLYNCQYCDYSAKTYSDLRKHLADHEELKVFRCIQSNCHKTFKELEKFVEHSLSHKESVFACHLCDKSFDSLQELGSHRYKEHQDGNQEKSTPKKNRRFKCKICTAQFRTMESLVHHEALDSHNYICPICNSMFTGERYLRRHLQSHSTIADFECAHCTKRFKTERSLKEHNLIHLKEKPFSCDYCKKKFCSKFRLERHISIHLNLRYVCSFKEYLGCEKTFYRKDKLKEHLASHTNTKINTCDICNKSFRSNIKLVKHKQSEHNVTVSVQKFTKGKKTVLSNCSDYKEQPRSQISNIEILVMNESLPL